MGRTEPGPCYGPDCDHVSHAPRKIDTTLRQWCPECAKATASWTDADGYAHCAQCDPPDEFD